jgi:hypothetical protein
MKKNYLYGFLFLCIATIGIAYVPRPYIICGGIIIEEAAGLEK